MASRLIFTFAAVALVCGCMLQTAEAARVARQNNGLSDDEKVEMLRAHNHFRGMVSPIATNMERMVKCMWHKEQPAPPTLIAVFYNAGVAP